MHSYIVASCPFKPRPGRVRGFVLDGIYRRHPLTGDREHHFSLPNQRDGEHMAGGRTRPGSHHKELRADDRRRRTGVGGMEEAPESTNYLESHGDPKDLDCVPCSRFLY